MAIRDFVLPIVMFGIMFSLTPVVAAYAIMVGGQAHFLMAYLYQYRGKKMQRPLYLVSALILLGLALLYFTTFTGTDRYLPIYLLVSIVFGIHFAIDEITLHKETWDMRRFLTVAGFSSIYSFATVFAAFPNLVIYSVIGIALLGVLLFIRVLLGGKPSRAELYLYLLSFLILGLLLFLPAFLHPYTLIGVIAWLHFLNWGIGYGMKLRGQGAKERRYWTETGGTLAVSVVVFLIFISFPQGPARYFFDYAFYNAWGLAHIVLSFAASVGAAKLVSPTA